MKIKYIRSIVILFLAALTFACAHQSYGTRAYVAALEELTTLLNSYQASYALASPEARAKWDKEITPLFLEAEETMKTWALTLDMAHDTTDIQSSFLLLRKAILTALIEVQKG